MAYQPTILWNRYLRGSFDDLALALTTGLDNAIYVAGYTYGNLDGNSDIRRDAFITKYNAEGNLEWTKLLGGNAVWEDSAYALTTGSDGAIYVAGDTPINLDGQKNNGSYNGYPQGTKDAFIVKYNTDGSKEWTNLLGGWRDDHARALTTDSYGSIYVAG